MERNTKLHENYRTCISIHNIRFTFPESISNQMNFNQFRIQFGEKKYFSRKVIAKHHQICSFREKQERYVSIVSAFMYYVSDRSIDHLQCIDSVHLPPSVRLFIDSSGRSFTRFYAVHTEWHETRCTCCMHLRACGGRMRAERKPRVRDCHYNALHSYFFPPNRFTRSPFTRSPPPPARPPANDRPTGLKRAASHGEYELLRLPSRF